MSRGDLSGIFGKHKVMYLYSIFKLNWRNIGESPGIDHCTPETNILKNNDG